MKEKSVAVLSLVFFGGFLSALVVSGIVAYFTLRFFVDGYHLSNAVETQQKVYTLNEIREGNLAKAIERLERGLDSGLMALARKNPTARTDEAVAKSIALAQEYRAKHPRRSSSPEIDKIVEEILSEK